ncbi:MAG: efflux RND transporter periplasmic adaptor subunit [Betaproteobacteria bacterium]
MHRTSPRLIPTLVLALALAACKGPPAPQTAAAPLPPLLLSAEDVLTIRNGALSAGPAVTGSIQPERRADVRAEVPAIVLRVLKENGDQVRRGEVLVQLDDTALRDMLASADATSRAAGQAFEQAQRQFERMKTLRTSGMVSTQGVEDSEIRRNNLQSDLEAAKARVVQARQQLQRTEARAPFDGVVSERKVSPGDTAQIGKELLKVIDPTSMRFEALVSADQVGNVKPGQSAHFRVNGYGNQEFAGKVRRVNPAANPTTRQVELLVDLVGDKQPKLAGLYAEGRVETEVRSSLTIPASAVMKSGDSAFAWRVNDSKLQKITLGITERDSRSGDYVLKSGLGEGDQVIRYPTALLKDNQPVQTGTTKAAMAENPSGNKEK